MTTGSISYVAFSRTNHATLDDAFYIRIGIRGSLKILHPSRIEICQPRPRLAFSLIRQKIDTDVYLHLQLVINAILSFVCC